jgi:hypothetical protein
MAKGKRKSSAPKEAAAPTTIVTRESSLPARFRIASAPPDVAMGQTLARQVSRLNREVFVNTARGLLSGQLTLQGVLSSLASAGSEATGSAAKETQRAGAQQALVSKQLREQLIRTRTNAQPPRMRKDDYVVRGQVMLATGEPVVGVAVEAIDKDVSKHDLLGTTLTDEKGTFQIAFARKTFAESGEKEPEIVLAVGLEGRTPLHVTEPTRMVSGERALTVTVTLPQATPPVTNVPREQLGDELDARMLRVQQREAVAAIQSQHFGALMQEAQTALGVLAAMLQPPAPNKSPSSSPVPASKSRRKR